MPSTRACERLSEELGEMLPSKHAGPKRLKQYCKARSSKSNSRTKPFKREEVIDLRDEILS